MSYSVIVKRTGDRINFEEKESALRFVKGVGRNEDVLLEKNHAIQNYYSIVEDKTNGVDVKEMNVPEVYGVNEIMEREGVYCARNDDLVEGWPDGLVQEELQSVFPIRF